MDKLKHKLEYALKHNLLLLNIYKKVMGFVFRTWGRFLKMDEKLILFSAHGRKYNDSPRVIFEKMTADTRFKDYRFVWALDNPEVIDVKGCDKVKADTIQYFKIALKAKYWVTSVNIERGLKFKKKETIFLNTWHGMSINHVGNAVSKRNDYDLSDLDYFCFSGEYEREFIKRDFNVRNESLLPSGLPRNDELYHADEAYKIELKKKLNIPLDKKVILYAPTWRDSSDGGSNYELIPPIDWKKWEKILKNDFIVLLRTHVYTTKLMNVEFNDFVREATSYDQVNHLMIVSDILISDYSAIQHDFAILGRPMICFGYDYDNYIKKRGFYYDLEDTMTNGVIRNEDNVLSLIQNMNYEEQCERTKVFCKKFADYGGNATEMCIKALFK